MEWYVVFPKGATDFTINATGGKVLEGFRFSAVELVCQDTDGDGILDYLDLDSDNDGCPDAVEGAASFTAANLDGNGSLIGAVDVNGTPTIAGSPQSTTASVTTATQVNVDAAALIDKSVIDGNATSFTITSASATNTTTFAAGIPNYTIPPGTDSSASIVYQWQVSTDNGVTFTDLVDGGIYTGTGTDTLNISNVAGLDGNVYNLVVTHTDHSCTRIENSATLTVQLPKISVIKTASVGGTGTIGDTITYSFLVSNEGNVPLTGVIIDDDRIGVSGLAVPDLAVGASETVTADYTITAQDLIDGKISNQAIGTGTSPSGVDVNDTSDDNSSTEDNETVTALTQVPKISVIKTASVGGTGIVGDTITYEFNVTNIGNVPLTNVTLTDVNATVSGGAIATLAVGESDAVTFTATHVITQADVDAGGVINQAVATGTDPNDNTTTDNSDDPTNGTDHDPDGDGDPDDPTFTALTNPPVAVDDYKLGTAGAATTVNVLENDTDPDNDIDASTVNFNPASIPGSTGTDTDGDGDIDEVVVPGEGTWTVDSTGAVTFTPEAGFTGDPTAVKYTVTDNTGLESNEATVTVDYPQTPADDNATGTAGQPVEVDVLSNDDTVDPTTVKIVDPANPGTPVTTLTVPGEQYISNINATPLKYSYPIYFCLI